MSEHKVVCKNVFELNRGDFELLIQTNSISLLATGDLAKRLRRVPAGARLNVSGNMEEVQNIDGKTIEVLKISEVIK